MAQTDFLPKEIESFNTDNIEVVQLDNADCGLACLVSVHAYYGGRISVSEIRFFSNTEISGTRMSDLAKAAEQLGYRARGVKANKTYLSQIDKPVIAHLQEGERGHYVVVFAVSPKSVQWMDPSSGRLRRIRMGVFLNQWTGYLLHLDPIFKSKKFRGKPTPVEPKQYSFQWDVETLNFKWTTWINVGFFAFGFMCLILYAEWSQSALNWIVGLTFLLVLEYLAERIQRQAVKDLKRKALIWIKDVIRVMIRIPPHFFEGMSIDDMINRLGDPSICARYQERHIKLPLDLVALMTVFFMLVIHSGHHLGSILLLLPMINSTLMLSTRQVGFSTDRTQKECLSQLSWLQFIQEKFNFNWINFWRIFNQAERQAFDQNKLGKENKLNSIVAILQLSILLFFGSFYFIFEIPQSYDLFQILGSFYLVYKLRAIASFYRLRSKFKRSSKRLQEMLNFRRAESL